MELAQQVCTDNSAFIVQIISTTAAAAGLAVLAIGFSLRNRFVGPASQNNGVAAAA